MAGSISRAVILLLVFLVITLGCFTSSIESRKLLRVQERLYLNSLPKGKVPSSTPSKKGHAQIMSEEQVIPAPRPTNSPVIDRILRSVPSPGIGH
ncbi:hypothetical protein M9H77_28585 [Catharanthus roseus]|uniref:Uncharacterized protein n=1 Tax=Catharanthus roseus TaxID=4058 RepID=A0ACC0AIE7_CATRO|nr:hypothetical protein M9H77_28585 [Catharanthus roseus]